MHVWFGLALDWNLQAMAKASQSVNCEADIRLCYQKMRAKINKHYSTFINGGS